jgi:Uma2 family endonuclease
MAIETAPPTEIALISGEAFAVLADLGLCELVAGRIVPVTPPGFDHGEIEFNIGAEIRAFVRANNLGRVSGGEAGIYTSRNPDTVRGADVIFISHERYAQRTTQTFLDVALDLVVEVLSPNNAWSEIMQKLREYFAIGVRLIWLVDPQVRSVFAYRSLTDVREFSADDELPGDDVLPGFTISVASLFTS